ncbi:hypothetical protein SAMN05444514_1555, partial [Pseudomonas syringae]|uniref:hypothetical protein n=2 Tax=Pseudomonas syringae TaxID=317 RepID=UPI000897B606
TEIGTDVASMVVPVSSAGKFGQLAKASEASSLARAENVLVAKSGAFLDLAATSRSEAIGGSSVAGLADDAGDFYGLNVSNVDYTSQLERTGTVRADGAFAAKSNDVVLAKYNEPCCLADGAKAAVNVRSASFADDAKLIGHFEKHGAEFGAKSSIEYLQTGKDIMQGGDKVQYLYKGEMRTGYVQFMGNSSRGDAKYGFVGTNSDGVITTIHVESGKSFWKMLNGDPKDKTIRPVP